VDRIAEGAAVREAADMGVEVLRYAAFTTTPAGGNPAGVVLDAGSLTDEQMQRIAADVGYSETAFLVPGSPDASGVRTRYFSPLAEVPFCGHATIATAVAHAERHGAGQLALDTPAGVVTVVTSIDDDGQVSATLTSVAPRHAPVSGQDRAEALAALRWEAEELDPALPAAVAYAGAWHLVLAAATRERLAALDYDFDRLGRLMAARHWTTVDLVWRESTLVFHARNPFPPGGVVEDPATGAAAAALGGYLRAHDLVPAPAEVTVHQGHDMGRPSTLVVSVPARAGAPISVTGTAVPLTA
jgi:PhzF family phenazine biosynthesis protein